MVPGLWTARQILHNHNQPPNQPTNQPLCCRYAEGGEGKSQGERERDLRESIVKMEAGVRDLNREVVETQKEEAGLRKESKRLLGEQQRMRDEAARIRGEAAGVGDDTRLQVEELEAQILDLTTFINVQKKIEKNGGEAEGGRVLFTAGGEEEKKKGKKGKGKKGRR